MSDWPGVYMEYIRSLSLTPQAFFVAGCWPVYRHLFLSVNLISCKACQGIKEHCFDSQTCRAWKKFTETKKDSAARQRRKKRNSRPGDNALINLLSTDDFARPSVYIGFRLRASLELCWSDVLSVSCRGPWIFAPSANNSVRTQSCPTPPSRSARRSDLTHP